MTGEAAVRGTGEKQLPRFAKERGVYPEGNTLSGLRFRNNAPVWNRKGV